MVALSTGLVLGRLSDGVSPAHRSAPTAALDPPYGTLAAPTLRPLPTQHLPQSGNGPLLLRALTVLDACKSRDFAALSKLVDQDGVRFTPLSTVDVSQNLVFTAAQVAKLDGDTTKYVWGSDSGTGKPISLTPGAYFNRYVWTADYTTATLLGVNQVLASGNALENVANAYPNCSFVEFYFPGIDPAKEGFDWCSLKLVFRQRGTYYMLAGIIHSEWTA